MTVLFSQSTRGFYREDLHGARKITIDDPAWARPLIDVTLQPGESYQLVDGSLLFNDGAEAQTERNVPDASAIAPTIEIDNPDCKIPPDAVEITDEVHAAVLAGQSQGQRIVADEAGAPVLQAPPPPSHAELVDLALNAARKERQPILSVLDGLQSSALATGNSSMATLIETAKQSLRDITSLDLAACVTYEDMRLAFKARYAQLVSAAPQVAIAFGEVVA
jgi:hypothetical protein